jgi:hypothetical protein
MIVSSYDYSYLPGPRVQVADSVEIPTTSTNMFCVQLSLTYFPSVSQLLHDNVRTPDCGNILLCGFVLVH